MEELFAVPGAPWVGVSPRLATLRRWLCLAVAAAVVVGVAGIGMLLSLSWWVLGAAAIAVVVALPAAWWFIGRTVSSWGYAERDDDLFVRRGRAFLRCVVVPYGRMQLVDVTAGPLQRRFGVATVHLHTAAPDTGARIPGLVPEEAARLRDRLTALGEAQASGL